MFGARRHTIGSCLALGLIVMMVGCETVRSTRSTADDYNEVAAEMAAALSGSDLLRHRSPDSPVWVVSLDKVQNLSSDVMSPGEQWGIMAQIIGALPIQSLWDTKHVRFVIPPERARALREKDPKEFAEYGAQRDVTHTMTGQFKSVTRVSPLQNGRQSRTDLYQTFFEIVDLKTGEIVWSDQFAYKREAKGAIWD